MKQWRDNRLRDNDYLCGKFGVLKLKYIIPIVVALGLIALLNFGATTVNPLLHSKKPGVKQASATGQKMPVMNFDSVVSDLKMKLPPEIQANVSLLVNKINNDVKEQKIKDYESLGNIWLASGKKAIAAHYFGESGKLEKSEKKLNFAGHLLYDQLKGDDIMPQKKIWMEQQAIAFYTAALEINPLNDTTKINLASLYMDAKQPMKGVEELLDVVGRDSTNVPANILLGKWSVQSNQLDKAIERGRIVLRQKPQNVDARLFMGEAFKRKGDKKKAIELFKEAEKIVNDPSFTADIDKYIATFK